MNTELQTPAAPLPRYRERKTQRHRDLVCLFSLSGRKKMRRLLEIFGVVFQAGTLQVALLFMRYSRVYPLQAVGISTEILDWFTTLMMLHLPHWQISFNIITRPLFEAVGSF